MKSEKLAKVIKSDQNKRAFFNVVISYQLSFIVQVCTLALAELNCSYEANNNLFTVIAAAAKLEVQQQIHFFMKRRFYLFQPTIVKYSCETAPFN